MSMVAINWKPQAGELRKFGISMLVGWGLVGALFYFVFKYTLTAYIMWGAGGTLGILGLTGTALALPGYWVWMGFAFVMGNIVSRIFMFLLYFGPVLITGLLQRMTGRDRLRLKKKDYDTYWVDMTPPAEELERHERQY